MKAFRIRPLARRFARDEDGLVITEFLFAMCWLCWWYVASFAIFDGFRQYNASIKATYTVGDILSRQMVEIDDSFLNGLQGLYEYLIKFGSDAELRYTSLKWVAAQSRYEVDWSYATGERDRLTTADLAGMSDRLPVLVDGEHVLLVESWSTYNTLFSVGVSQGLEFHNYMVTSPRFAPRVVYPPQS
ncbi:TadE/TadG family type IV pilus assembly protein [Dinoroseobacter sp. S124A]|uniref:TadE/TadG family type IV pilus assembly protein n=1 Tax=Dinoroseobacter sp. S124A TaxID=3415128 RepID=UPI003C7A1C3E